MPIEAALEGVERQNGTMTFAVSQLTPTPKTLQLALLQLAGLDVVVQVVANRVEGSADLAAEAGHGGNRAESDQTSNQGVFDQVLAGLILHKGDNRLLDFLHHGSSPVVLRLSLVSASVI